VRCRRSCSAAAAGGSAREQRGRAWRTSRAVEEKAAEGTALMQADHGPRRGKGGGYGGELEGEAVKQRRRPDATSSKEPRCSQARRAPFIHAEVGVGATRRGFDAQHMTGSGGRPALMAL
jgi:hypothetical protein